MPESNSRLAPLATHTAHFGLIRRTGQAYVDKTAYIQRMLERPMQYAFLARPRRFGKSLLVSTLAHLYSRAHDDLFQGLAIRQSGFLDSVPRCPVLTLDMSGVRAGCPQDAYDDLREVVTEQCLKLGLAPPDDLPPWIAFNRLLLQLSDTCAQGVVVLVDEYDAPLTDLLGADPPPSESVRTQVMDHLRHFYRTLKRREDCLRFVFVTGITRFVNAGMFSALNNLEDLSSRSAYHAVCGFTEAEVDAYLAAHIVHSAVNYGCSPAHLRTEMRRHYDGYRFVPHNEPVYNPVSYLRALDQLTDRRDAQVIRAMGFPRPWVDTGKPSFLFRHMKRRGLGLRDIDASPAGIWEAFSLQDPPLNALMFQAGYLTLRTDEGAVRLDYPNREVVASLQKGLLCAYLGKPVGRHSAVMQLIEAMAAALQAGDCRQACACFDRILDKVTYRELERASDFQVALHLVCSIMTGVLGAASETLGRKGRSDIVAETEEAFYVFELKRNGTVKEAVDQIIAQEYGHKYFGEGKQVIGIGLNFVVPDKEAAEMWEASARNFDMETVNLLARRDGATAVVKAGSSLTVGAMQDV